MRIIILAQCAGMISNLVFQNGFMLAFLSNTGLPGSTILTLLALPQLMVFILILPFAYVSDRVGKKKIAILGQALGISGFLILMLNPSTFLNNEVRMFLGIGIFGAGSALFTSNWFALLKPIIPGEIRGRFFGKMRASWQTVAILFTTGTTLVLEKNVSSLVYQTFIAGIAFLLFIRLLLYLKIPEIEKTHNDFSFLASLRFVFRIPGYLQFCCYLFLLMLSVGAIPWVLSLLEKEYLGFSDKELVLMGNFLAIGSLIGFYIGGKCVDYWGTKPVFLFIHFLFGTVLFSFVGRSWFPFSQLTTIAVLTSIFGFCLAASSIANAAEMMFLIPKENISLSTALNISMTAGGSALSGILIGKILNFQVLNKSWVLWGQTMTEIDTILLGGSIMVLLLVVTLGLIPSVMGQQKMFPVNRVW